MKTKLLALIMAVMLSGIWGMTAWAADLTVTFTAGGEMVYSGTTGSSRQGVLFGDSETVLPGDRVVRLITLKNENAGAADFYLNIEALQAFEKAASDAGRSAEGASYSVALKSGEDVVYDSNVGGYTDSSTADGKGLEGINEALQGYLYMGTLEKGQSRNVELTIEIDGEAMTGSGDSVGYTNLLGNIGFQFMATARDIPVPVTVYQEVRREGEKTIVRRVVDRVAILATPVTGDSGAVGAAVALLPAGGTMIWIAIRRKRKEYQS